MKKFLCVITLILLLITSLCACKTESKLIGYVSELKSEEYYGETENYKLHASYGYKEVPVKTDGEVGNKEYFLFFKLKGNVSDNSTYVLSFNYGEEKFKQVFSFHPVMNVLTAKINIDNFTEKEFSVDIFFGANKESIVLKSVIPENTIDINTALNYLESNQKNLLDNYYDDSGKFNAEIKARIIVKDEKPYWYFALVNTEGKVKALLVDGLNGNVLAVREVF